MLQNRSAYFSLDPSHPNRLEPGKTPLHTLIASMGFRRGKLWSVVGCMGTDGQPQIHLQTFGDTVQAARGSSTPRWRARARICIQPEAKATTGSGKRCAHGVEVAEGGQMMILPANFWLSDFCFFSSVAGSSGPRSTPRRSYMSHSAFIAPWM